MRNQHASLTGKECTFDRSEIIVSKTDLKGRITYANDVFLRVAGYTEEELLNQPHSIIRHPDMPRSVFKFLWDTIESGQEIFAYVVNRCKNGDHYWVFAHVTPTFNPQGNIIGYHSNRRVPDRSSVNIVTDLYKMLRDEEQRHDDPRKGMNASLKILVDILQEKEIGYDEFVFSITPTEEQV